ncbi:MAG: DUF3817 domain-containing protein [Actinomycetes bacterium]
MSSIRTLRYVAIVEATSFLILLGATVVKYATDAPGGVSVMGPVHGMLFLAYVVVAINVRGAVGWSGRTTVGVLLGAVIPFGGYAVDRWLARQLQPVAA